jgi:hypothetical protein
MVVDPEPPKLEGVNVADAPAGRPAALNATEPLNPFIATLLMA